MVQQYKSSISQSRAKAGPEKRQTQVQMHENKRLKYAIILPINHAYIIRCHNLCIRQHFQLHQQKIDLVIDVAARPMARQSYIKN